MEYSSNAKKIKKLQVDSYNCFILNAYKWFKKTFRNTNGKNWTLLKDIYLPNWTNKMFKKGVILKTYKNNIVLNWSILKTK